MIIFLAKSSTMIEKNFEFRGSEISQNEGNLKENISTTIEVLELEFRISVNSNRNQIFTDGQTRPSLFPPFHENYPTYRKKKFWKKFWIIYREENMNERF